jgi:HAD superfamily hydrolase (TIGR01549 family)
VALDKNIKLVIFDFDGTLFHLNIDWDKLKTDLGLSKDLNLGEAIQSFHEKGDKKTKIITETEILAVKGRKLEDEVAKTIVNLQQQSYKIAIFSRNSSEAIATVLKNSGLGESIFICGREHTAKLKPNSEGLQLILDHFSLNSIEAIMVGDTYHDIEAANALGMHVTIVANANNSYSPNGAHRYIASLSELRS